MVRGIAKTLITAILGALIGSAITLYAAPIVMNDEETNTNENQQKIVVQGDGKSENIYRAVTEKSMPSVVGITTVTIDRSNIFSLPQELQGVGTGVIVNSDGYILTNSHVVSDGEAVDVGVLFNDGSTLQGKVLWNDPQMDLALVKVNKTGLSVADLGDSDTVQIGDIAVAIGNPLGLEFQRSVTQGIISGLDRSIQTENASMTGLMQTDASINPGNSGGPLLNSKGEVIGINTAKAAQGEGLGFSIPINTAKPIIDQIIKNGDFEKVMLGIKGVDVQNYEAATGEKLQSDEGVYVVEVVSNSPANKSGIRAGDIIKEIDGDNISSMSDLNKVLYKYSLGDKIRITVNRSGNIKTFNITFNK